MPFGYVPSFPNQRCQQLFGKFIKFERIEQNISLNELAKIIGIDASFLSSIENGKKAPSGIMSEYICDALAVSFDFSEASEQEYKSLIKQYYQLLINEDQGSQLLYVQLQQQKYYASYAFPLVLLASLLQDKLFEGKEVDVKLINKLRELAEFEDDSFLVLLTDLQIMALNENEKIVEEYRDFLKNVRSVESFDLFGEFPLANLKLHAATYFSDAGYLLNSLQYASEAQSGFQKCLSLKGLLAVKSLNAKNFAILKDYTSAIREYLELSSNALVAADNGLKAMCYENIGSILYNSKRFEEAVDYFNQAIQLDVNCKHARYYLILTYYELSDYAMISELSERFISFDDLMNKYVIQLVKALILKDNLGIESLVEAMQKDIQFDSIEEIVNGLLFRYYTDQQLFEKANQYAANLLRLLI